jgi:hypothetical protein
MSNQENKLRVKLSTFKTELTFNEWVEKYNVSRDYIEPTKYYQGNNSSGYKPLELQRVGNPFLNLFIK